MDTVGFIGLGTMGMPMATNLARAGVPLVVHDVNPAAAAAAAKVPGIGVAGSPALVAARSTVLFTCLPNDAIVRDVYLGPAGIATEARAGLVTCDASTVSPETTLAVGQALATKGATSSSSSAATRRRSRRSRPTWSAWAGATCTRAAPAWPTA